MQHYSNQAALNTSTAPGSEARVLNQGNSDTCTCYAIANAVADQLAEKQIDIDQSVFAGILVDKKGNIGAVWPDFYDNYHSSILIKDDKSGRHYSIKITTVRPVEKFTDNHRHILAYYTNTNKYHCVFVEGKKGNYYSCLNSWGNYDPKPQIALNKDGNKLWIVSVDFVPIG